MSNLPEDSQDEYPIIWFQSEIDFALKARIIEKKTVHFFSELVEAAEFAKYLGISFLFIAPNEFDEEEEEKMLENMKILKDTRGRRVADFEEEAILEGLQAAKSFKVYVFYTKEDFESEIFVEEGVMKWDVKEAAKDFREEFTFWERKQRGLEKGVAVFAKSEESQAIADSWSQEDSLANEEFCMKSLKELVYKRRQEKRKLIYYVSISESYYQLKKCQLAIEYLEKALSIMASIYEESNGSITYLLSSIAWIYQDLEEGEKAHEPALRTLKISKLLYGEEHAETAIAYRCVAYTYRSLNEFQKAEEFYIKALEIRKNVFGEVHVKTADIYDDLGEMYSDEQEYENALACYLKILQINTSAYGENHKNTLISHCDIAYVYEALEQREKGIPHRLKALEISISLNGEIHQKVIDSHRELRDAYVELQDRRKILEHELKILEISISLYGEASFQTASSYLSIGEAFMVVGDYQKAIKFLSKALDVEKVCLRRDPENVLSQIGQINFHLKSCQRTIYQTRVNHEISSWI